MCYVRYFVRRWIDGNQFLFFSWIVHDVGNHYMTNICWVFSVGDVFQMSDGGASILKLEARGVLVGVLILVGGVCVMLSCLRSTCDIAILDRISPRIRKIWTSNTHLRMFQQMCWRCPNSMSGIIDCNCTFLERRFGA